METKRSDSPIPLQTSPSVGLHRLLREGFRGDLHVQLAGSLLGRQAKICHAPPHRFNPKRLIDSPFMLENARWQDALPAKRPVTCSACPCNSNICGGGALTGCVFSAEHFKCRSVLPPAPITSDSVLGICSSSRNAFLSAHLGYLHKALLFSSPLLFKHPDLPVKGMMSRIHLDVRGGAVATDLQRLPDAQSCEPGGCLCFRSEQ